MSTNTLRRELAHRNSNGGNVSLFWDRANNTLSLEVRDERLREFFKLCVPSDRALDAFHHPYAYRAQSRTEDREPLAA